MSRLITVLLLASIIFAEAQAHGQPDPALTAIQHRVGHSLVINYRETGLRDDNDCDHDDTTSIVASARIKETWLCPLGVVARSSFMVTQSQTQCGETISGRLRLKAPTASPCPGGELHRVHYRHVMVTDVTHGVSTVPVK